MSREAGENKQRKLQELAKNRESEKQRGREGRCQQADQESINKEWRIIEVQEDMEEMVSEGIIQKRKPEQLEKKMWEMRQQIDQGRELEKKNQEQQKEQILQHLEIILEKLKKQGE